MKDKDSKLLEETYSQINERIGRNPDDLAQYKDNYNKGYIPDSDDEYYNNFDPERGINFKVFRASEMGSPNQKMDSVTFKTIHEVIDFLKKVQYDITISIDNAEPTITIQD